ADSTGESIAVDLSNNTTSINFESTHNIIGDVHLGSGVNTIRLEGITQEEYDDLYKFYDDAGFEESVFIDLLDRNLNGTIFLEGGSATLDMYKNTVLTGGIYSPNGQLNVTLNDISELRVLPDIALNVENLKLNDESKLVVEISNEGTFTGGVHASGDVTFSPNSELKVDIQALVGVQDSFEIITANSLTIDGSSNIINSNDQLYIYDIQTTIDANSLSVGLRRKGAVELGLSENLSQIYEASIPALIANSDVAAEISSIVTEEEFAEIYTQMMPNSITQASRQILMNSNNLSLGAVSAQLDNLRRLKYIPDGKLLSGQSMWAQQYGTMYNHDATAYEKGANGFTFGIAAGYELAVTKRGAIGISIAKNFADIKLDNAGLSRMGMENTQAGIYGGIWFSDFFVQAQANVGLLDFESDRDVLFQTGKRTSTADWGGLQYSSSLKAGYQVNLGSFSLTPTAAINYLNIKQDAYTEAGGGGGIDLAVDEYRTSSMTSNLKMELAYTKAIGGEGSVGNFSVGIHGGWLNELKDDVSSVTANFAGYDSPFTLTGNPLDKNAYQAGAGVYFVTAITNFSLVYDVDWKDNYMAHSAMMNFRVRF
ncbi:MAG: autotransporter outer membrane beta-barrel domain-containing protein, partial [Emcibacteraceae bacterium]|nr:autotransporter outer membrane beta-barrel domain-containing protein [Emcibacteraceae bacterium]